MSILINLAIGLALSAVSMLLAPKPQAPQEQKQKVLGSKRGPSRFNTTYGFDGTAALAGWGDPIPIAFGKYTGSSGGLLITPKLVWSRLFSYGNQQAIKALYVCAEWGIGKPNLQGIYMGNAPLETAYGHMFAVYYRNTAGTNRIRGGDLLYGTRARPDSGDPETYDDVFSCPSLDAENDEAFCYAYTPSNQTQFGIYNPIANGTGIRAMWRVVSYPQEGSSETKERIVAERLKICGRASRDAGMPGVGREYVRGVGIWRVDGQAYDVVTDVRIYAGSIIEVVIAAGKIPNLYDDSKTGVNCEDLNGSLENERAAADDLLQLGETVQIGRSSWRVIHRSAPVWRKKQEQVVTLQCVETFGWPYVTAIPRDLIDKWNNVNGGQNFNSNNHVGLSATPIASQAMGIVKNVRESDVIEVGIKSQVWNQANGMMNWNDVPEPPQLKKWDEDNVQVTGGTLSRYMLRTSAFTIKVRPAGDNPDGSGPYQWAPIGEQFCIRGQAPVDQFNFIRIYFPQLGKYEFRFEPLPAAVIVRNFPPTELFWHLNVKSNKILRRFYPTTYGTFELYTIGEEVPQADLLTNREMGYVDDDAETEVIGNGPNSVAVDHYNTAVYDDPHGKAHGWRNELLGWAALNQGVTKSAEITAERVGPVGLELKLKITCTCLYVPHTLCTPSGYSPALYTDWIWGPPTVQVVGFEDNPVSPWAVGDVVTFTLPITREADNKNNKWLHRAYTNGARKVTASFVVQGKGEVKVRIPAGTYTRNFVPSSQIADVTFYPGAWSKSNDNGPEHEISYVNEIRANEPIIPTYNDLTMLGFALKSGKNFTKLDQLRIWVPGGIQVYRHLTKDVGRSNLFSDFVYWLLTDRNAGMGDVISSEIIDTESFERTARFLEANRIYFDYVLEDPTNLRQWITDMGKLVMCTFTIIDGKFGIEPALPATSAGALSTEPVPIAAIFTEGNIIEGSFTLDYFSYEQRQDFRAVVSYRSANRKSALGDEYELPQETTATVRYGGADTGRPPLEMVDLADFCTQRQQATLTAKYMLAMRRRITHTVKFQSSPLGLNLKPNDYIRVVTQANPYTPASNGVVLAENGRVVTPTPLVDGTYTVTYYRPSMEQVEDTTLTVKDGHVTDAALWGAAFSVRPIKVTSNVYQVQQISLTEEGLAEIVAAEFPCDDQLRSLIVMDMLNDDLWEVSQ